MQKLTNLWTVIFFVLSVRNRELRLLLKSGGLFGSLAYKYYILFVLLYPEMNPLSACLFCII